MTDPRFYTDETQHRLLVYGSTGYGKTYAHRQFVKFAGSFNTDGRWRRGVGPRFANIKAALTATLERVK